MAKKTKYYLVIPSKELIYEWNGEIKDTRNFTQVTPRGKELVGLLGKVGNNDYYNIFMTTQTDAKSFITFMKNRQKKIDKGEKVELIGQKPSK